MTGAGITFDTLIVLGIFVVVSVFAIVLVHEYLIWTERFKCATAVMFTYMLVALGVLDQILVHLEALPFP